MILTVVTALAGLAPAAGADTDAFDGHEHGPIAIPESEMPTGFSSERVVYDMIFPIVGGRDFGDNYGACRGAGCSRRHEGIDIMAPKMTPLVAVADGTVGWMHNTQGGQCCAMEINHDDGWESWYIHMNNDTPGTDDGQGWGFAEGIEPGARIHAGQLIGWVGDSGNAEHTSPHLHFELHKPGGIVINPYDSLVAGTVIHAPLGQNEIQGCDLDGDGRDEVIVAAPFEDLGADGSKPDAGAVTVLYGKGTGPSADGSEIWHLNSSGVDGALRGNDRFGAATACGDFNDDGYDDLAIGAPYRKVNGRNFAGTVTILEGSADGLVATGDNLWHLGRSGVPGSLDPKDNFGAALAVGDFDGDGFDDLAAAAPGKTRNGKRFAGVVVVFHGSSSGLAPEALLAENVGGIDGAAEKGDRFGTTLAAGDFNDNGRDDLVIGIPHENVPNRLDTGAVVIVSGTENGLSPNVSQRIDADDAASGAAEAGTSFGVALAVGDFNGDGLSDLAVGAPGASVGGVAAGEVAVFDGGGSAMVRTESLDSLRQGFGGMPGSNTNGNRFGASAVAGDFDGDGADDLAIGAPWDNVDGVTRAGTVTVVPGGPDGLVKGQAEEWSQATTGVGSAPAEGEEFGAWVATGDFTGSQTAGLVIGVPNEDVGGKTDAGLVHTILGETGFGLRAATHELWKENTAGVPGKAEADDGWSVLVG